MHPSAADLDVSLLTLFTGWAMTDEIQRRLTTSGHGDLRFNDGVVIQHVLAGPLSISALADRMGVTQQAASKTVVDLERRGLLVRRPSPDDARAKLLHLTERGAAAVDAARRQRAQVDRELTERFGPARVGELRAMLSEILALFDAEDSIRNRRVRPPT